MKINAGVRKRIRTVSANPDSCLAYRWPILSILFKKFNKILILGIGNELKGDDGFGPVIAEKLSGYQTKNVKVINCGIVPENYFSEILRFKPECIIIFDTMVKDQESKKTQKVEIRSISQIPGTFGFTHNFSLVNYFKLIKKESGCEIFFVLYRAKNFYFNSVLSKGTPAVIGRIVTEIIKRIKTV